MTKPASDTYKLKNIRTAIGHYLLGRGASAVLGLGSTILLVRSMSTSDYAAYIAMLGICGIATMLSSLGLNRVVTRFVPEGVLYQTPTVLKRFLLRLLATRLLAASLMAAAVGLLWQWIVSMFGFFESRQIPWSIVVFLLSTPLFALLSTTLEALLRQKLLTRILVLIWGSRFAWLAITATSFQTEISLDHALWIMAVPECLGALTLLVVVLLDIQKRTRSESEITAISTWPNWHDISNLAGHAFAFEALASIPQGYFMRTIVAATLPAETTAAYGFFSNLVDRIKMYLPMQLMYNLIEPTVVARYLNDRDEQALSRSIGLMYKTNLLILVMTLLFLFIAGDVVVRQLTGGRYVEQAWILLLLVIQIALGSNVMAIQLFVNVLKKNFILSLAAATALSVMLIFLTVVTGSDKPTWVLFCALVYSLAMNTTAFILLAKYRLTYRPPIREVVTLCFLALVIALIFNSLAAATNESASGLYAILQALSASTLFLLLAYKSQYVNATEIALIRKILRR